MLHFPPYPHSSSPLLLRSGHAEDWEQNCYGKHIRLSLHASQTRIEGHTVLFALACRGSQLLLRSMGFDPPSPNSLSAFPSEPALKPCRHLHGVDLQCLLCLPTIYFLGLFTYASLLQLHCPSLLPNQFHHPSALPAVHISPHFHLESGISHAELLRYLRDHRGDG